MNLTHFLFILSCLYGIISTPILQSSTATTIVLPAGASAISSDYFNKNHPNFLGTGVSWITSSVRALNTHYQSLFYSNCIGKANLTITASQGFTAYLDGVLIGSGTNSSNIYRFLVNITCGNHNFTVVVHFARGNPGLTFLIDQDQSGCYNCQLTGYWNENTCSCACTASPCQCVAPKVWKTYPVCGCGCPPVYVLGTAAISRIRLPPLCFAPRYYSQETCSCVCHIGYCPPRSYYDIVNCRCNEIIP